MKGDHRLERALIRDVAGRLPGSLGRAATMIGEEPAATPTATVAVGGAGAGGLARINQIVVLMLENRSFDTMLGYLSLEGGRGDVDGLRGRDVNFNVYGGKQVPIHHLTETAWTGELEDPCHGPACIDQQIQLDRSMGGFVQSYADYITEFVRTHPGTPPVDPALVMGYYNAADLPVFDFLAGEYCVCDRWFSSLPGATWPNRLYAVAGRADGDREDASPPLYNLPSFARHLDAAGVPWKWYSYDPGTLRAVDAEYRLSHHEHFAYVDQRKISVQERAAGEFLREEGSFLDEAAAGKLPSVSWIDPHFKDLRVFGPDSNDDHPPSDVLAGQALVLDVYHALRNSPQWETTLLLITYDEHGGIYDHVPPPDPAPDGSPDPQFHRYGVRVPALVVSPLVERRSVAPREPIFDHTSIIKTILLRFCQRDGRIPDMGARVTAAHHLGGLLTRTAPRTDIPAHEDLAARIGDWRKRFVDARYTDGYAPPQPPRRLTHLQHGYATVARLLREAGLPSGHP